VIISGDIHLLSGGISIQRVAEFLGSLQARV
jgi:hypothetical protein